MSEFTRVRGRSMISCEQLERRTLFAVTPSPHIKYPQIRVSETSQSAMQKRKDQTD